MIRLSHAPSILLIAAALLLVLLPVLASGCHSTAPGAGRPDPYQAPFNDPQITVIPQELRPWLGFQPARVEDDGAKPMQVQVPMRNMTERQYLLEYRVLFFDSAGMQLDPTMSWRFLPLDPKQNVRLSARALSTDAVDYKVEVRWAR